MLHVNVTSSIILCLKLFRALICVPEARVHLIKLEKRGVCGGPSSASMGSIKSTASKCRENPLTPKYLIVNAVVG